LGYFTSLAVLVLTVGLSLGRPKIGNWRIQHPSAAIGGAAVTLMLGLVPVDLAWRTIIQLSPSLATIVSLMIITLVTEKSGLMEKLALRIARWGRGDARRLFLYLFVMGTTTGVFFTNDATILIFTPLVFSLVAQVGQSDWTDRNRIPFYFAVLYVGNLVGALVISNPINIIVCSFFDIGFADYARWMVLPAVTSMVISFIGLRLYFRRDLPRRYDIPPADAEPVGDPSLIRACIVVLCITLFGFFTGHLSGIPVWLVAALGAAMLLVNAQRQGHPPGDILKGVGWDVLIFVVGIFIVVLGLRSAGLTEQIAGLLRDLVAHGEQGLVFGTGLVAAFCSAVLNNHPTAGLMIWSIQDLGLPELETRMIVFAALIGGDLGPKMLPIGSLAALMWFRMLRSRGVDVAYSTYVKVGVPVTLAAVLGALFVLDVQWRLAVL